MILIIITYILLANGLSLRQGNGSLHNFFIIGNTFSNSMAAFYFMSATNLTMNEIWFSSNNLDSKKKKKKL